MDAHLLPRFLTNNDKTANFRVAYCIRDRGPHASWVRRIGSIHCQNDDRVSGRVMWKSTPQVPDWRVHFVGLARRKYFAPYRRFAALHSVSPALVLLHGTDVDVLGQFESMWRKRRKRPGKLMQIPD